MTMDEVRAELEPLIRARGLRTVADEVGVSHVAVGRWLRGESAIGADKLATLAAVLGYRLSQDWRMQRVGQDEQSPTPPSSPPNGTP